MQNKFTSRRKEDIFSFPSRHVSVSRLICFTLHKVALILCGHSPNYISTYGWNPSPPQYLCGLQSQGTWTSQHEEVRTFPIPLRLRIELNSSDIPVALATNIHSGCITNAVFCLCHSGWWSSLILSPRIGESGVKDCVFEVLKHSLALSWIFITRVFGGHVPEGAVCQQRHKAVFLAACDQ